MAVMGPTMTACWLKPNSTRGGCLVPAACSALTAISRRPRPSAVQSMTRATYMDRMRWCWWNTTAAHSVSFVRTSGFNELRHNGTPYQFNGTRLIRYSTGADWQNAHNSSVTLRLYGSDERYRQTFSSIRTWQHLAPRLAHFAAAKFPRATPTFLQMSLALPRTGTKRLVRVCCCLPALMFTMSVYGMESKPLARRPHLLTSMTTSATLPATSK